MGNLKNNIDHYMELKGIKMYSHLLVDIAHELGINGQDAYKFANKEKSNFSKMLKDKRPLKYDFIIPLEKIFGVSLARLLDEDAYKLPVERDNLPFNKGFRYYAYLDDPKLYKEEFNILLAKNGESILTQSDEFGKTFLDYIVEYHSVNGVRYLYEEYGIKLKGDSNYFKFKKDSGITWINFDNSIAFARLVASMNDAELFNDIYDSYYMFFGLGFYISDYTIFSRSEYLEIMLDNDTLFSSIFEIRSYEYILGNRAKREKQVDSITFDLINPIINNCLRYALEHLGKYKHRAIDILKFGIKHNTEFINKVDADEYYICNELGGVTKFEQVGVIELERVGWVGCDIADIVVYVDVEVNDDEINALIEQLPKFKKSRFLQ